MFCENCGEELSDEVQFCTKCGKPIKTETETPQKNSKIPASKKIIDNIKSIGALIFIILLAVALVRNCSSYAERSGLKSTASEKNAIKTIKESYFDNYPSMTIGKAVDNFFSKPKWSAGLPEDNSLHGYMLVNCKGGITYDDKPVDAEIQFLLYSETGAFELNAFELNGIPQSQYMIISLLSAMYE